ncbi:hypothetical protein J5X84_36370 [Streptosporangiaceae bacterium NEAU-GS5]|nr:hypothetical protein [Streptosporangiaceae bacterium NEAU-GS5]
MPDHPAEIPLAPESLIPGVLGLIDQTEKSLAKIDEQRQQILAHMSAVDAEYQQQRAPLVAELQAVDLLTAIGAAARRRYLAMLEPPHQPPGGELEGPQTGSLAPVPAANGRQS